jgi:hypothetical protein
LAARCALTKASVEATPPFASAITYCASSAEATRIAAPGVIGAPAGLPAVGAV